MTDQTIKGVVDTDLKPLIQRIRQRMDSLRGHHNDSIEIHQQTQPKIDKQIHEETLKYLQVNGTKAKTKPRAPKRPRNTSTSSPAVTLSQSTVPPPQQQQQQQQQQQLPQHQPLHQHQYHQVPQQQPPQMYQTQHQQIYQPQQPQQQMYQPQQQQIYQPQQPQRQMYQPQEQQIYDPRPQQQQIYQPQPQLIYQPQQQQTQQIYRPQQVSRVSSSLPNDLDLNLQSGLECDIDSLIKHEMSVEGQLDFNHDLLLQLDNHYQPQPHYHH